MKKIFKYLTIAALGLGTAVSAHAEWERCLPLEYAYGVFHTSKGTVIASSFDRDLQGGMYWSDDNGTTWNDSEVMDYMFEDFVEAGKYVFASGNAYPRVARSANGGKTWTILNLRNVIKPWIDTSKEEDGETPIGIAGITFDPERNRLYVAFEGADFGVAYSDDWGMNWKMTDRESLLLPAAPQQGIPVDFMDFFYSIKYFNGKVYVAGMYHWAEYDADEDKWTLVREHDGEGNSQVLFSNFLCALEPNGDTMYAARASEATTMPDLNYYPPFVTKTKDCKHFTKSGYPEGEDYLYIRALHHTGNNLLAAVKNKTMYVSPDNGDTWADCAKGLPHYVPCTMTSDEKYVYAALYAVNENDFDKEGIYRLPIEELYTNARPAESKPEDSIAEIADEINVTITTTELSVATPRCRSIEIYDAAGRLQARGLGSSVSLSQLPAGVYVYNLNIPGNRTVGKFVK